MSEFEDALNYIKLDTIRSIPEILGFYHNTQQGVHSETKLGMMAALATDVRAAYHKNEGGVDILQVLTNARISLIPSDKYSVGVIPHKNSGYITVPSNTSANESIYCDNCTKRSEEHRVCVKYGHSLISVTSVIAKEHENGCKYYRSIKCIDNTSNAYFDTLKTDGINDDCRLMLSHLFAKYLLNQPLPYTVTKSVDETLYNTLTHNSRSKLTEFLGKIGLTKLSNYLQAKQLNVDKYKVLDNYYTTLCNLFTIMLFIQNDVSSMDASEIYEKFGIPQKFISHHTLM